jgi:hypothetical protein
MKWLKTAVVMVSVLTTGIDANVHTHKRGLVDAIHMVESSGRTGPILGDGGRALGPLQIHRACWIDANIGGTYSQCAGLAYSKRVFAAYMARYATSRRLGRPVTDEDRARIWNGGPNGYKKKATVAYWNKVKEQMND